MQALIQTVGTSPEPIRFAVSQPGVVAVAFIVTQETDKVAQAIRREFPDRLFQSYQIVDSPESMNRLIELGREAYSWLRDTAQVDHEGIAVDATGGRKWMSAAAALLATSLGVPMQYVDVEYDGRTPKHGSERIVPLENPIEQDPYIGYQKAQGYGKRALLATAIALEAIPTPSSADADLFAGLSAIYRTFHRYDLFEHLTTSLGKDFEDAMARVNRAARSRPRSQESISGFLSQVQTAKDLIEQIHLEKESETVTWIGEDGKEKSMRWPTPLLIADLINNARRRFDAGAYDDCVARCYRGFEAITQWILRRDLGITNLKSEVAARLEEGGERPGAGLDANCNLLRLTNPNVGALLYGQVNNVSSFKLRTPMEARNDSLLAHGTRPVDKIQAEKALAQLETLFEALSPGTPQVVIPELPPLFN